MNHSKPPPSFPGPLLLSHELPIAKLLLLRHSLLFRNNRIRTLLRRSPSCVLLELIRRQLRCNPGSCRTPIARPTPTPTPRRECPASSSWGIDSSSTPIPRTGPTTTKVREIHKSLTWALRNLGCGTYVDLDLDREIPPVLGLVCVAAWCACPRRDVTAVSPNPLRACWAALLAARA